MSNECIGCVHGGRNIGRITEMIRLTYQRTAPTTETVFFLFYLSEHLISRLISVNIQKKMPLESLNNTNFKSVRQSKDVFYLWFNNSNPCPLLPEHPPGGLLPL